MASRILIQNGIIIPFGSPCRVLEGQALLIEDGRIDRIAPAKDIQGPFDQVIDATGQVVMPGLVNIHSHPSSEPMNKGLIDEIGFIEKAIDRAIELAKLDPKDVKVVKYKAEPRLANLLFGQSEARKPLDLSLLLDSTTPRGYYLCTWLPMLAGSAK